MIRAPWAATGLRRTAAHRDPQAIGTLLSGRVQYVCQRRAYFSALFQNNAQKATAEPELARQDNFTTDDRGPHTTGAPRPRARRSRGCAFGRSL